MSSTRAYRFIDHTFDVVVVGAGGAGLRATKAPSRQAASQRCFRRVVIRLWPKGTCRQSRQHRQGQLAMACVQYGQWVRVARRPGRDRICSIYCSPTPWRYASMFFASSFPAILIVPLVYKNARVLTWGIPAFAIVAGAVSLESFVASDLPRWLLALGDARIRSISSTGLCSRRSALCLPESSRPACRPKRSRSFCASRLARSSDRCFRLDQKSDAARVETQIDVELKNAGTVTLDEQQKRRFAGVCLMTIVSVIRIS